MAAHDDDTRPDKDSIIERSLASGQLCIHPEYQLLICIREDCGFALSPNPDRVSEHLRTRHSTPGDTRKQITTILRSRDLQLRDPAIAGQRPDGSPRDALLRCHDGFLCDTCPFRTISKPMIQRHISQQHPTATSRNKGRPGAIRVCLQAWVRNPPRSEYWVVARNDIATTSGLLLSASRDERHLNEALARERAFRERSQRAGDGGNPTAHAGEAPFTEMQPWLERTKWPCVYESVNRELLRSLTMRPSRRSRPVMLSQGRLNRQDIISPAEDEAKIAALCEATSRVMTRCEETAKTTGRNALCWLRSIRPNSCFPKPFAAVATESTRKCYLSIAQRFVAMVFRAYRLTPAVQRNEAGVPLTKEQLLACQSIWDHADLESRTLSAREISESLDGELCDDDWQEEDFEDQESSSDSEGEDEDVSLEDAQLKGAAGCGRVGRGSGDSAPALSFPHEEPVSDMVYATRAGLDELVFGLLVMFCKQKVCGGDPSRTILVYFAGILGFAQDRSGFRPPRTYTSYLAALLYVQRLLFLEYAIPEKGYASLNIPARGDRDRLTRLQNVRKEYMVCGAESPFEELFSLLCYGKKIAANSTPPFFLHWSDDAETVTVSDECSISMEDFKRLPKGLITQAEQVCGELLYHLAPTDRLDAIRDNLTQTKSGFSFVHHSANELSNEYLRLCNRACTGSSAGLILHGKWDFGLVHGYLKKEEQFLEILAVLMHITGGGLPRSPDVLHLRCENTGSVERGIYVQDGLLFYLTRSHKAKRSTNMEFFVARFLPRAVSRLLFYYLVYIRPFVDMLSREVYPGIRGSCCIYLFRRGPEPTAEPWRASRLSKLIRQASATAWGNGGVSTQLLRQLAVGITEKHVRYASGRFNLYDDRSPQADRNVVFAWQTGHRPLQRAATYGLDGAFPTKLQPALLERYRWASSCWHHFLELSADMQSNSGKRLSCPLQSDTPCKKPRLAHATKEEPAWARTQVQDAIRVLREALQHREASLESPMALTLLKGLSWASSWDDATTIAADNPGRESRGASTGGSLSLELAPIPQPRTPCQATTLFPEVPDVHNADTTGYGDAQGETASTSDMCGSVPAHDFADVSYLSEWRVILCKLCGYCLRPEKEALKRHLRQHPHDMRGEGLRNLVEMLLSHGPRPMDEELERWPVDTVPGLSVYDGFRCLRCGPSTAFLTRNAGKIRRHVSKEHQEVPLSHERKQQSIPWEPCKLQTFFAETKFIRYFVVK